MQLSEMHVTVVTYFSSFIVAGTVICLLHFTFLTFGKIFWIVSKLISSENFGYSNKYLK